MTLKQDTNLILALIEPYRPRLSRVPLFITSSVFKCKVSFFFSLSADVLLNVVLNVFSGLLLQRSFLILVL